MALVSQHCEFLKTATRFSVMYILQQFFSKVRELVQMTFQPTFHLLRQVRGVPPVRAQRDWPGDKEWGQTTSRLSRT